MEIENKPETGKPKKKPFDVKEWQNANSDKISKADRTYYLKMVNDPVFVEKKRAWARARYYRLKEQRQ